MYVSLIHFAFHDNVINHVMRQLQYRAIDKTSTGQDMTGMAEMLILLKARCEWVQCLAWDTIAAPHSHASFRL